MLCFFFSLCFRGGARETVLPQGSTRKMSFVGFELRTLCMSTTQITIGLRGFMTLPNNNLAKMASVLSNCLPQSVKDKAICSERCPTESGNLQGFDSRSMHKEYKYKVFLCGDEIGLFCFFILCFIVMFTGLRFEEVPNVTLEKVGAKSVPLSTTGKEKTMFTVFLASQVIVNAQGDVMKTTKEKPPLLDRVVISFIMYVLPMLLSEREQRKGKFKKRYQMPQCKGGAKQPPQTTDGWTERISWLDAGA